MCVCSSGGIGCDGEDRGQSRRCLSSVEIYNPDTDTWRAGPTLPTSLLSLRTNASNIGVVEGKLYLCGHFKGAGQLLNTCHCFEWSLRKPFPNKFNFRLECTLWICIRVRECQLIGEAVFLEIRFWSAIPYILFFLMTAGRHEIITKEILELDPANNVWTVVERRAAMHDSYDVCLVANLNPRDLFTA